MLEAALRGKPLGLRAEDALTATVFGMLRYLPPHILRGWLQSAQPVDRAGALMLDALDIEVEFWPSWLDTFRGEGRVEPDVVLTSGTTVYVIEAKLDSPQGEDQLAREWKSACDHCATEWRGQRSLGGLLYVTAHLTLPNADFDQAFAALKNRPCPPPSFYWLPWSGLSAQFTPEHIGAHTFVVADLLRYLSETKLLRFKGWNHTCLGGAVWRYARPETRPYWQAMLEKFEGFWHYRRGTGTYWDFLGSHRSESLATQWTYPKGEKQWKT